MYRPHMNCRKTSILFCKSIVADEKKYVFKNMDIEMGIEHSFTVKVFTLIFDIRISIIHLTLHSLSKVI